MRYFQRTQNRGAGLSDNDPLTGIANLFDLGLVFIVGLLLALFGTYHLEDLLRQDSQLTITKESSNGEMEIITKKGTKIEAIKVTKDKAKGKGQRLGVAYRLKDGSMVYVPEKENPAADPPRQ
ncbi:DUF2149 domain-containing protein [Desulfogranum marinum]|jgi:hypothetical protein|uniref:DUF2149 domain-containing protein n=1 Tax=Desulfogranum marinum TaxID=453220 RepID=UPI001963B7D8|nr:DUF2149 domain-containing protein [Desulfogranum marinum]MBM9513767.1 DUF2149 domain-containing protein [Desulfogranum marinum]